MNTLQLCKYLISVNPELIAKTAMSNCHCIGLNSFIINEKPKVRLYIAQPDCELFRLFDYLYPQIPIHAHKYDDLFSQLEGTTTHHLYKLGGTCAFNEYRYRRISDQKTKLELLGVEYLKYLGPKTGVIELKAPELHTVSLQGERCSWLITETFEDKNFQQKAYHKKLIERPELYKPMPNSNEYLESYFEF